MLTSPAVMPAASSTSACVIVIRFPAWRASPAAGHPARAKSRTPGPVVIPSQYVRDPAARLTSAAPVGDHGNRHIGQRTLDRPHIGQGTQ